MTDKHASRRKRKPDIAIHVVAGLADLFLPERLDWIGTALDQIGALVSVVTADDHWDEADEVALASALSNLTHIIGEGVRGMGRGAAQA